MDENDQHAADSSDAAYAALEAPVEQHAPVPGHRVRLPGGDWTIWRWVGLRSAGFPIERLLQLGDPVCAAAADRLRALDDRLEQARDAALQALRDMLERVEAGRRAQLVKAIQQIKKQQAPAAPAVPEVEAALAALREASAQARAAAEDFRGAYQAALARTTQALHTVARDDRFREALIWQNRHALRTGVDAFLRKPPDATARSSKYRQHEALIANYIQRYSTKNDTIGFFGPVGWARVVDAGAAASIRPGVALLATRTVYFDGWCIDALAETLARDDSLAPWLAPRRLPYIHIDGAVLYVPLAPPCPLPPAQAAVLRACNGERTARQLAADLLKNPANGIKSEAEVFAILKKLRSLRRIVWTLEVPAEGLYPERALRQRLQQVEDQRVRAAALGALDELEGARAAVGAAIGAPDLLDQAMEDLEATFTRLTGAAATRRAGETYAGRTLVYEDCRRDVEVTFGPDLIAAIGLPLTLMLTSARWFTYETAQIYRKAFRSIYDELVRKTGSRTVEFTSFWFMAHALIFGKQGEEIEPLVNELQERWAALLDLPPGQHQIAYSGEQLRRRVFEAFDAPDPGWSSARYHSPDLMIAAASAEAIAQGQYQCVMGELHPGANTLKTALFVGQHPAARELFQAIDADLPAQVVVVATREEGGPTSRLTTALLSPKDFRFVFAHDSCGVAPARALTTGALVLEADDRTLVARTRDGRLRFDIIELLSEFIMVKVLHHFDIIRRSSHTPRISIDRLVICRESWRFTPAELAFADCTGEADRFTGARRWAHTHGIPRYVFVKTPTEKKPFVVDFDSVIGIELFAKAIRRAAAGNAPEASIAITEMLPDPSQTWLLDREGQRYTCELRIVAVDGGG